MPFALPLAEDNRSGTPHPRVHRDPWGPASSPGSLLLCCPLARAPARAPAEEGTSSPNTQPASAPDATVIYTSFPAVSVGQGKFVTGQCGQNSIFVAASDTGAGNTVPPSARFHESRSKRGCERRQICSVSHPAAQSHPGRPDEKEEEEEEGKRARQGKGRLRRDARRQSVVLMGRRGQSFVVLIFLHMRWDAPDSQFRRPRARTGGGPRRRRPDPWRYRSEPRKCRWDLLEDAGQRPSETQAGPLETQAGDGRRSRRDPQKRRRETLGDAGGTLEDAGGEPPETLCLQVSQRFTREAALEG